jgi:kumamolisin
MPTESSARFSIPGSERTTPRDVVTTGKPDGSERTTVTVMLRPRKSPHAAVARLARQSPAERSYLTREAFAAEYGADPDDVLELERFALAHHLIVLEANLARRAVVLEGTLDALGTAFGTSFQLYRAASGTYRGRVGSLSVPSHIGPLVAGVFGLDERPQARTHFRRAFRPAAATATSYPAPEVGSAYAFPSGLDGSGETIALIELGGGFAQSDLDTYFSGLGIATPSVTSVGVDGATNVPDQDPNGADGEVLLDIEVAGALAPGAKIVVYFAPNTDQGFLDAVTTAINDAVNRPSIVSISWGGPEATWTASAMTNFDNAFADGATMGVTVLVAAGDGGSSDGETDGLAHVDFPASSPHVVGCGGTALLYNGTAITSETVWNDGSAGGATGGGVSDVFALPSWQANAGVPPSVNAGGRIGRGVPDVAGDASPETGYNVVVDGTSEVIGGTSAVAPLYAALVARLNQKLQTPLGLVNPQLYANPGAFHDIVSGNNGAYSAKAGWDACTGLGSPDGALLLAALGTASTAATR